MFNHKYLIVFIITGFVSISCTSIGHNQNEALRSDNSNITIEYTDIKFNIYIPGLNSSPLGEQL